MPRRNHVVPQFPHLSSGAKPLPSVPFDNLPAGGSDGTRALTSSKKGLQGHRTRQSHSTKTLHGGS